MQLLLLISELEDQYQIQIPLDELQLEDFKDVVSIAELVKKQSRGITNDN